MQLALAISPAPPAARSNATHIVPGWGEVYVAGDATLLARPAVAIIGSRHASREACALTSALAAQLVSQGIVIVSGLAAGIDAVAHTAAMDAKGRTVAIIGTSLAEAYVSMPRSRRASRVSISSSLRSRSARRRPAGTSRDGTG